VAFQTLELLFRVPGVGSADLRLATVLGTLRLIEGIGQLIQVHCVSFENRYQPLGGCDQGRGQLEAFMRCMTVSRFAWSTFLLAAS